MPFGPNRAPSGLFLILALLVLVLSVDVFGFLGVGDPKGSNAVGAAPSATAAWKSLNTDGRQLLDREHESVVAEIKLRLEHEHLLFSLKFGLVGAILWAFLQTPLKTDTQFDTTPFAALAAWSAVVAAAIVDLRVMANQTFLVTLGGWSRQYEQLALGANSAGLGWEGFLADRLLGEPFYPALRISGGQILTALLFCVTSSIFLLRPEGQSDPRTTRISGAGAIVSIVIMTMAAVSMRHDRDAMFLYIVVGGLAIVVAALLAHAARERGRAAAPDAYDAPPA